MKRRYCHECSAWHERPKDGPCPKHARLTPEDIKLRLLHLVGQRDRNYRNQVLASLAETINDLCPELRDHFLDHPELGFYLMQLNERNRRFAYTADDKFVLPRLQPENLRSNSSKRFMDHAFSWPSQQPEKLGDNTAKLILDHDNLVRSIARKFAPNSPAWREELRTHLLEKLIELWPQWDEDRGVTFGRFAKPRLMGAARDYIKHRPKTVNMDSSYIDIATRNKTRKAPKQDSDDITNKHWSTGDRRTEGFIRGRSEPIVPMSKKIKPPPLSKAAPAQSTNKSPSSLDDELKAALAKLNHRQRVVYTGTVLTEPPISRYRLALELGIRDITQISRIKRQAEQRVAKYFKKCHPPSGI